jgi:hypothetical protein
MNLWQAHQILMDVDDWASGTGFEHQPMFLLPRLQPTLRETLEPINVHNGLH